MSVPQSAHQRQILAAATGSPMEDKPPRFPNGFPFPFCVPSSSPSSVFPSLPIFAPQLQQMYASMIQQQFLNMAQQQQQQSPVLRNDLSPNLSDQTSSRGESPTVKKLQVDDEGCPICPLCGEKLAESQWAEHVEQEKNKLMGVIISVKESKHCDPSSNSEQSRRKRELELLRIRNNQIKRMALKRGSVAHIRDSLTPFSRQSNDESGSSGSPTCGTSGVKTEEPDAYGNIKCSTCLRNSEYGIVTGVFDQPRCQDCYNALRVQTGVLPASITSLLDVNLTSAASSPSPSSSTSCPPEKKIRVE